MLSDGDKPTNLFDIPLMTAVAHFQRRHGLKADGVVGRETLGALNIPIRHRIRQIELNLERWRWIPHDLGARHIRVNIADYNLQVVEAGKPVLKMNVVVGRDYRRTPVFSDTLQYLVFNPYWNVPFSIAVKDKLPLIQEDPSYLASHHIRVFAGWKPDAPQVDPATVDWSRLSRANFRYRLRQDPGPHNALGQIKFMFPNPFAVYLHDTSDKGLFSQDVRTFSSGCIRVADPINLAAYVLRGQHPWSKERIQATIESQRRKVVNLQHTLPIHLFYWTAWVAADGTLNFRNDIYQRDIPLDQALKERVILGEEGVSL
jgi:murein L,D-transpeptidase YcbB/YkuD